jgi:hypothetical protein
MPTGNAQLATCSIGAPAGPRGRGAAGEQQRPFVSMIFASWLDSRGGWAARAGGPVWPGRRDGPTGTTQAARLARRPDVPASLSTNLGGTS